MRCATDDRRFIADFTLSLVTIVTFLDSESRNRRLVLFRIGIGQETALETL